MNPLAYSPINPPWASPTTVINPLPAPSSNAKRPPSLHRSSSSFREPKVFGAPGIGLVDPTPNQGSTSQSKTVPYLRVRIGGLERNRKDVLIRFDASTSLPNFRTTMYRNMQRSYVEFQRFAEQISLTSPQTIIPALPLASTSAVTDEEDDRLVRIGLQRWFTRICEDSVLLRDDELRAFIEADFGYSPVPPPSVRRPTSATSAVPNVLSSALSKVIRRGPLDEDDELQSAKGALEGLEIRWGGAAAAIGALGKARRAHALANQEVGAKLISLSTVESDVHLATAERKVGRAWEQLAGMAAAQAASENVVLSDSLGYQALNARAGKDALLQRTQILEDSQTATKTAINKRRNVERLKGSSNINPIKVDDAISEMQDADKLEHQLSGRLTAISQNLHIALRAHSQQTHDDVALALLENARLTVGFHKHLLRELEALRPDLARIATNAPAHSTPVRNPAPAPPQMPVPTMAPSRPYQSPSRAPAMETSKSMFLPPPSQPEVARPSSAAPPPSTAKVDPLSGQVAPTMVQSMMLPGQAGRAQTVGRAGGKRLDERQAAKMLAGGF